MKQNPRAWLIRHSCFRKIRHATERAAHDHARRHFETLGKQLDVYPCRHCGGWHIGKSSYKG
jgi:hypothetical protein